VTGPGFTLASGFVHHGQWRLSEIDRISAPILRSRLVLAVRHNLR